jgi:Flp pilus assembly protein TadG
MRAGRNTGSEHGAIAVEFALVMLPLIVLLFGSIQYGLYFWAMQGGSDIARSAARNSAVGDAATSTCAHFRADVLDQIRGVGGDTSTAKITRTYIDAQSPPDGVTVGDSVKISVQFRSIDLHFPFVPFLHHGLVTSRGDSRVDFVPDVDNPPQSCS